MKVFKKFLSIMLILALLVPFIPNISHAFSISASTTLEIGQTDTGYFSTSQDGYIIKNITLSSSNPSVGTVEQTGEGTYKFTALSKGSANVIVTWELDPSTPWTDGTTSVSITHSYQVGLEKHRLSFDLQGGTYPDSTDNIDVYEGHTYELKTPTKEGATFKEWKITSGTGASISQDGKKFTMGTTDATVTAVWENEDEQQYKGLWWKDDNGVKHYYGDGSSSSDQIMYVGNTYDFGWDNPSKQGELKVMLAGEVVLSTSETQAQFTPEKSGYIYLKFEEIKEAGTGDVYALGFDVIDNTPKSYTLTIDPNGGTYSGETTQTVEEGKTATIATPTREGYTFAGWEVTGTGSSISTDGKTFTMGTVNATIKAKWNVNSYKLTINPNGGTYEGSTGDKTVNVNYKGTETIATPTREGYTFKGWTVSGTGASISTDGKTFTMGTADATLTASWDVNSYTLTINPNGGTYSGQTTQTVEYGKSVEIATPTRTGYTFTGWTKTGGTLEGTTFTMSEKNNVTLTANWTANEYNYIVYHKKMNIDGSAYTLVADDTETGNKALGETVTPNTKSYTGFTKPSQQTITIAEDTNPPVKNVVNYEYARNQHKLTINTAGGTFEDSTQKSEQTLYYEQTAEITNPVREGYNFSGWEVSSGSMTDKIFTMGDADATLTAKWTPIEYIISVNLDEGTLDGEIPTKYTIESEDIKIGTPTKDGSTFVGWTGTEIEEGTTEIVIKKGSTGNRKYMANWEEVESTNTTTTTPSKPTVLPKAGESTKQVMLTLIALALCVALFARIKMYKNRDIK